MEGIEFGNILEAGKQKQEDGRWKRERKISPLG
jgi:hypothetical protein